MAYSAGIDIMLPVLLALTAVLAVCCASFVVRVVTGNHKQFSTIKRINGKRTTVCKVVNAVKTFAAIALAILALAPEYTALLIGAILTLLTALINISLIITSDAHLFVLICTRNLMYSFLNCYRTEEELAAGLTPSESIDRLMGLIFSSPFILAALTYFDGYAVLTTSRSIVPFVLNLVISLVDRCLADNDALATLSMLNCSAVTALVAFHCYLKGIRAAESGSENSWVPFEIASFFLAYFTGILTIVQFFSPSSFNWLISALLFKPFLQPLLHYIIAPLLSYIIFPALQLYAICFFLPWIVVLLIIFLTAKIASACLIAFKTIVFVFTGDKYPDEHISLRKGTLYFVLYDLTNQSSATASWQLSNRCSSLTPSSLSVRLNSIRTDL